MAVTPFPAVPEGAVPGAFTPGDPGLNTGSSQLVPFPAVPGQAHPGASAPGDPGLGGATGGVLNQWSATATGDPGLVLASVANQAKSALVAFVGWNGTSFPTQANITVADDAHNYWQPLAVSPASFNGGIRSAILIATNVTPATVVSISASFPVSNLAALIVEFPGMPQLVGTDFAPKASATLATSISASTSAMKSDWVFTVMASGNNTSTITAPGSPWNALNAVAVNDPAGAGGQQDIKITPMYAAVTPGTVAASFTASITTPMAIAMAGITQTSPTVVNPGNPNWPMFTVQAAFGAQVGLNQDAWNWTDISSRAILGDSDAIFDYQGGRSYELTGPEAGTIKVLLNNNDGALTPGNTTSPYYPNVRPETPIRIIATWNNTIYPVAFGYVDKWPQTFASPQWGMTNTTASDAMGVLANLDLNSAYQSEVLLDQPYSYWPFGEGYGEANGLPFENLGSVVTNTKPMVGFDGQSTGSAILSTGLALNLQGDGGSGIGMTGLTASLPTWGSGAICVDPAMASKIAGNFSVEFWASLPTTGTFTTPLASLLGSPTNFSSAGGPVRFQAAAMSGTPYKMQVVLADFLGHSFTSTAFALPNDGNAHHHVFTVSLSGSTWTITHYLDGAYDTKVTNGTVTLFNDITIAVFGPALITPIAASPFNYTLAHGAIYSLLLPATRIAAHYQIGSAGASGDTVEARFKRVMAWSQAHLPMAATLPSTAPLMGAAFTLAGQTVTDAFNDMLISEGGWSYVDSAGNTWWASRESFYNRSPKWIFGDNPANGEIPYDPGQSFDFDNAYLFTQTSAVRQAGQATQVTTSTTEGVSTQTFEATGAQVRVVSVPAQSSYGNRNSLQQSILTTSDQDVYDRAFWSLQKYSSASLRVPQIVIDAASNPALWPVVLGVEQGDVVQVVRRPLGAAPYTMSGIVVQVHVEVGINKGQVTLGIVPYNIEANIIHVDDPVYGTLASGIGW